MMDDNVVNKNLFTALDFSGQLLAFANKADAVREDVGCGVLYGMIRDAAYKMRTMAESELKQHELDGILKR